MWAQDQGKNNLKTLLVIAEIFVIAVVVIGLASFIWENTSINSLDFSLQIVFVGLFVLLVVFLANYIINRRW